MDADVVAALRDHCEETHGQIRYAMGQEVENAVRQYLAMDETARLEAKLDEVVGAISDAELERERQRPKQGPTVSASNQTEQQVQNILAELPNNATVSETVVETAIEAHPGGSYKTLKKYKEQLMKRGRMFAHPVKPETFVMGREKIALVMETAQDVTPADVDELLAEYDNLLNDDWYLEALRDDYIESNSLKYDEVVDGYADTPTSAEYRDAKGLADPNRGFS
jgi:hypothetical protein